ncbi:hypothetical protein [Aphanizomenon flos-aquae]|uniref:hypothetical protein n=1 Tax=Aphanizomenon flos-aquae TaxID=1176 RepID=UPI000B24C3F0|nr:hypothetical protein [Aphanizomenon flos-aquae]
MSESGFPGFQDLQDEGDSVVNSSDRCGNLSESGFPRFQDLQDEVANLRIINDERSLWEIV